MASKLKNMLNTLGFIAMELGYVVWGVFFAIVLPFMNSLAPVNSLIGKIRFIFSLYSVIIGILYLVTVYLIVRRKRLGLKFAILVNVLGIPFLIPIVLGLGSLYYFSRSSIKGQFK